MAENWSPQEATLIIEDYFQMLKKEIAGQSYNKSEHRRILSKKLNERSDTAIENKHMNISSVLVELGAPYINGYKPYSHRQKILLELVLEQLATDAELHQIVTDRLQSPVLEHGPQVFNFDNVRQEAPPPPQPQEYVNEATPAYGSGRKGIFRDYSKLEALNTKLGEQGELFIINYERHYLNLQKRSDLAKKVEHVSKSCGDGLGFDVLSYSPDGAEKHIEVKTTRFGKFHKFYLSKNELEYSKSAEDRFHLYRVYKFDTDRHFFSLPGAVDQHCVLEAQQYSATF